MLHILLYFIIYINEGFSLWTKGVVHYAINSKDYDLHSQDIITSTMSDVQKELCIKFFNTPSNYAATVDNKILYINNPDKRKHCAPETLNFTGSVVDMIIGYKCINRKDVTRMLVAMLRASIEETAAKKVNSYDLVRKFQEQEEDPASPTLLSPADRNFINAHYHSECGALSFGRRSAKRQEYEGVRVSPQNEAYYRDKLWPLGVVMYGVDRKLHNSQHHKQLRHAMATLELECCVVFQELEDEELRARSLLWFAPAGASAPQLGFVQGNQTIFLEDMIISPHKDIETDRSQLSISISVWSSSGSSLDRLFQSISLEDMIVGAPGHAAHTLSLLMRALGLPMMSNRYDRDYYINVNWNNVEKGKEHYLERTPREAWLQDSQYDYDFESVTHAPANYMCRSCRFGESTIQPAQDHLWLRTMMMGRNTRLTAGDKEMLHVLYDKPCQDRYASHFK